MSDAQKAERLGGYLRTIAQGGSVESIAERDPVEMTGPFGEASKSEIRLAKRGVEKLAQNKQPDRREMAAVEAIILPAERPVIDINDGDFTITDPLWAHVASDELYHANVTRALPLIGRIEIPKMPSKPFAGTGFVVGPNLLMTNRHVAELFALGEGVEQLRFKPGQVAGIDFRRETLEQETRMLSIEKVRMIHPYWDMALLEVSGLPPAHGHLTLDPVDPEDRIGREVAVIGYPAFDSRNNAQLQMRLFNSRFDIKRLLPGKMRARREVESYGGMVAAAQHDASTLGGNSGSAVIDLESGHVIALHFAGIYLDANFAVPAADLGLDGRVVDAGVTFTRDVRVDPTPWASDWADADPGEATASATAPSKPSPQVVAGTPVTATQDGVIEIPLTVTVKLGS